MKKVYFYMMTALMAFTMASCDNWDSPYYDTPHLNDDIVGSWESVYGRDVYGEYDIWGYDAVRFDFYSNHKGRYTYFSDFGMDYVGFDWDTRGDRLFIHYYDGDFEGLYYGYDDYGYLILSLDWNFYEYTAYTPCGSGTWYYEPAKTMQKAPAKQSTGDLVTQREQGAKLKSLSRGIIVRDTE